MDVRIESSWKGVLGDEFTKPYFTELSHFVRDRYMQTRVFPPPKNIFHAFDMCPFESVKVVILGQDPYHGVGQAHGLCFSVPDAVRVPPSLQNIYREIQDDLGLPIPDTGNLDRWAEQGVLLLNSILTVESGQPASHQGKGWEQFTDAVIASVSTKKERVVFLLWGKYAIEKGKQIDHTKHCVLTAAHPSPFSAHQGFFGCKHFSKTNEYLVTWGKTPVTW